VVLVVLCASLLGSLLFLRSPVKLDVVRDRGVMARLVEDGYIENLYRLQVMNASEQVRSYTLTVSGMDQLALAKPVELTVQPAEARWVSVALRVPPEVAAKAGSGAHAIQFQLRGAEVLGSVSKAGLAVEEKSTFVVPR